MFGVSWTEKSTGWIPQQLWCLFQILGFGNLRQFIWNSPIVCCFFPYADEQKITPKSGGGFECVSVFSCFHLRMEEFLGAKHGCRNTVLDDLAETGGYRTGRGVGTIGQRMDTNLVGAEGGANGMAFLIYYLYILRVSGGLGKLRNISNITTNSK